MTVVLFVPARSVVAPTLRLDPPAEGICEDVHVGEVDHLVVVFFVVEGLGGGSGWTTVHCGRCYSHVPSLVVIVLSRCGGSS